MDPAMMGMARPIACSSRNNVSPEAVKITHVNVVGWSIFVIQHQFTVRWYRRLAEVKIVPKCNGKRSEQQPAWLTQQCSEAS